MNHTSNDDWVKHEIGRCYGVPYGTYGALGKMRGETERLQWETQRKLTTPEVRRREEPRVRQREKYENRAPKDESGGLGSYLLAALFLFFLMGMFGGDNKTSAPDEHAAAEAEIAVPQKSTPLAEPVQQPDAGLAAQAQSEVVQTTAEPIAGSDAAEVHPADDAAAAPLAVEPVN